MAEEETVHREAKAHSDVREYFSVSGRHFLFAINQSSKASPAAAAVVAAEGNNTEGVVKK